MVVCTLFGAANTRSQKCNQAMCGSQASRSRCCFGQRGSARGKLTHLRWVEDEEEATWRPSPPTPPLEGEVGGDQSGSDLEGGDVLGNDNNIESVSSESDKMVHAAAEQEVEVMGVATRFSSRRSAPEWCENSKEEGTHGR